MTQSAAMTNAIDRYFELSLFLLLATGFATLAGTGKLDETSILLLLVALALRAYFLLQRRIVAIPERWTTALTIAYMGFYALDYFFLSRGFVPATVHLVLFSVAVKIFSIHRERDYLYLALLSFLMVLAAAVLTIDTVFLLSFSLFAVLSVAAFSSLEIRRSLRATQQAGAAARISPKLSGSLSRTTVVLVLGILLLSVLIFFLLPRATGGYLSGFAAKDALVTGFNEEVTLGAIGTIQQSNDVVMHIQFAPGSTPPLDMKWRGMALALFDGRRWSNPRNQGLQVLPNSPGSGFKLPVFGEKASLSAPVLSYRVIMEPTATNLFFVLPTGTNIAGNYRFLALGFGNSIHNLDRERPIGTYTATSVIYPVPSQVQRLEISKVDPGIALPYLQTPKLDPRIPRLAKQIVSGVNGSYRRAEAIQQYLLTHYGYTLELADSEGVDPLSFFLFDRRQGHCEYFASAMAIMLRTLDIPSRVVNGFRGGDLNDVNNTYIVRQRNAHSWVEAYIPPYGWVTFDPTPAGVQLPANRWARFLLYMDALRVYWREWVVNFDFTRQNALNRQIATDTRSYARETGQWTGHQYARLQGALRKLQLQLIHYPLAWAIRILTGLSFLLVVLGAPRLYRSLRTLRILRRPHEAPGKSATLWYQKMARRLARDGYARKPSQTPEEFAVSIHEPELRDRVATFTGHYERARFADSAPDAERLEELLDGIETALRK